jgi:cytoskeleton protein RodZ
VDTLGQELRRKRENLNIELRDVAEATRVGVRFLHAIEADDFSALPGGIYARSFIRAYAKHVGLDEEEAVSRYRKQTNQIEDQSEEPQLQRDFPTNEPSQFSLGLVVVGLLAVIATGGFVATRYFSGNNSVPAVPTGATAANQPANTASPSNSAPAPQQIPVANNSGVPADTTTPAPTDSAIQQAVQTTDNMVLTFIASGESWLSVRQDDQASPQMLTIQAGQKQEFKASSKFKVTVGNLPAVKVLINGQSARLTTTNGLQAINILISKENFQEYIAAASNPNAKLPKTEVKRPPKPVTDPNTTGETTASPKPAAPVNKPASSGTNGETTPAVKPPSKPKLENKDFKPVPKPETEKPKTESGTDNN